MISGIIIKGEGEVNDTKADADRDAHKTSPVTMGIEKAKLSA